MSDSNARGRAVGCTAPGVGSLLDAFCFGDLAVPERDAFVAHVASCEACRTEVARLSRAIELMQNDDVLAQAVLASNLPSVLGMSDALDDRLAGHSRFVSAWAIGYGLLFAVALVVEGAYRFDLFGQQTLYTAVPLALWCGASARLAAWTDWRRTIEKRTDGLFWSGGILLGAVLAMLPVLYLLFPNDPVVMARFETHPMHAAFNKFAAFIVPMALVFFAVPLHFVMSMQRELRSPRRLLARQYLETGRGVLPSATYYLAPWVLGLLFAAAFAHQTLGALYLFDNVLPGPYRGLFIDVVQIRVFLYVVLAAAGGLWYAHMLNELRRECLAWGALEGTDSRSSGQQTRF